MNHDYSLHQRLKESDATVIRPLCNRYGQQVGGQ
jgi:hypothetical protein